MSKKSKNNDYYIGLDIGTDSVGWAVTDTDYRLLKYKGEPMWGSHLFEAGKQAAERRSFRTARRRLDRRQQRVKLVQELFAEEIAKIDPNFYKRIKASALRQEDKKSIDPALMDETNCVFSDEGWGDKEFHKIYPTIHHLIVDLMDLEETGEPRDIRLYYLVCAWFVAHRGHFLSEIDGDNIDKLTDIKPLYEDFEKWFIDRGLELPWNCSADNFDKVLNTKAKITEKEKLFAETLFGGKAPKDDKENYELSVSSLIKLFSGGETQIKKVFISDEVLSDNSDKISFRMDEETFEATLATLGDYDELIIFMKRIYDCAVLKDLQKGNKYISVAKVAQYEKHKNDLASLKRIIRQYAGTETVKIKGTENKEIPIYDVLFRYSEFITSENSYSAYVKNYKGFPKGAKLPKSASQEDFYKKIKSILTNIDLDKVTNNDKETIDNILKDIELGTFMPKQVVGDNRVIPKQLYYAEMKRVLEKASAQYEFLLKKDENGLSVTDKLLSVFNFRIPYFVGPLNNHSEFAWLERKAEGKILPWNIKDKVDFDKSEENFINRMTNSCTYLPGKDVIPRWSLLYSKYTVLNEINNITINNRKISVEIKQGIYESLFKSKKKVTVKDIKNYLISNVSGFDPNNDILGGIDININSSLKPWVDFRSLLDRKILSEDEVEKIISMSTYTEDNVRFRKWLKENYNLSEDDLKYVSKLGYKEFGRLSKELLNGIEGTSKQTGEVGTVMHFLWETNDNLMQIIADEDKYTFSEVIREEIQKSFTNKMTLNERLEQMGISNAVKRPIFRTLDVISDVVKAEKHPPKKIFIEMARGATEDQKNTRTTSRTNQLRKAYKFINDNDSKMLAAELDKLGDDSDKRLQSQKLYLYYLQMGKCMYCGKPLELSDINNNKYCDIDHIWPRAYVKDDSIINNKVLVHSEENGEKSDIYPLPTEWRVRMNGFWRSLYDSGLVSDEKYKRLTRATGFTNDEKTGFISRQLVETRQATKAVSEILGSRFGDSTEIVFVKAALASDFRHDFGNIKEKALGVPLTDIEKKNLELVKCRSINDIHHAKDAYLNIVAGNIYNTKFTKRFFDISKDSYSLKNKIVFGTPTKDGTTWDPQKHIPIVEKTMSNNHVHLTKFQTCQKGGLFDMQPVKASDSNLVPLKDGMDTTIYGGYNKSNATFFTLVSHQIKSKKELTFIPVDLLVSERFRNDKAFAIEYVKNKLGEKSTNISFPLANKIIKINTVISLDGFEVCIAGKGNGGVRLLVRSLVSSNYLNDKYVKRIEKVQEKTSSNKKYLLDYNDGISENDNCSLFMEIMNKVTGVFDKMPGAKINLEEKQLVAFQKLPLEKQVAVLSNLILYIKTNRAGTCDMSEIGGASSSGALYLSANVGNWKYKDVRIVDRSATGLFECKSINLKELL